jgi:plasmid stabilization system protein ParE
MTFGGLKLSLEAENDLKEACLWYENCREGLGHEFLLCVEASLEAIKRNPISFPIKYKSIRRALVRRFPYGIFYVVENDVPIILAISHNRRSDEHWRNRL